MIPHLRVVIRRIKLTTVVALGPASASSVRWLSAGLDPQCLYPFFVGLVINLAAERGALIQGKMPSYVKIPWLKTLRGNVGTYGFSIAIDLTDL